MRFKHYSFDLWLTIIRSNHEFKARRAQYFHEKYNGKNKSVEEVRHVFRNTDVMCNRINEVTGKNIDYDEMYLMIISAINDYDVDLGDVPVKEIYQELEDLFFRFRPVLYDENTKRVLEVLKSTSGTNILSNTGFIKGDTLSKLLQELQIDHLFDFQLYSDETRISKPNPEFFNRMIAQLPAGLPLDQVVHVGDNPRADILGAKAMGISAIQINSNEHRIQDLV